MVRCLPPRSGNAVFVMDPIHCGAGILMRCSSASTARHITYGVPLTMKAKFLRFLPQNGGDREAALRFLRRAMKRYGRPATIVTDRLQSYRAAMKVIGNECCQETRRWLNNRAENSHQPFRRRERAMARFRDVRTLQKFSSVHASIHNHFNHQRHLNSRDIFKQDRSAALAEWRQIAA